MLRHVPQPALGERTLSMVAYDHAVGGQRRGALDDGVRAHVVQDLERDRMPRLSRKTPGELPELGARLLAARDEQQIEQLLRSAARPADGASLAQRRDTLDRHFSQPDIASLLDSLQRDADEFAQATLQLLRQRSPLMLGVALEQVRRARTMALADELRMERDIMFHCFHPGGGGHGDAVEGIRALVIDKDRRPRWNPARLEDLDPSAVAGYFVSPWAPAEHPLAHLRDV